MKYLLAIALLTLSSLCLADTTAYTLSWPAQDGNIHVQVAEGAGRNRNRLRDAAIDRLVVAARSNDPDQRYADESQHPLR